MSWVITTITHPQTNITQRVVWCEETKCTVMTEEQMDMLNDNFIKRIIEHHNSALRISNKEHRDLVKECYREWIK